MIVLLILAALGLLAFVGVAVLSLVPDGLRRTLLPASPVVGAAVSVVALHWTTLLVGTRWGMPAILTAAVIVLVVQRIRHRPILRGARDWSVAAICVGAVGLVGAAIAVTPLLLAGHAYLVQASDSYDAFYYVSGARWLADHTLFTVPPQGSMPAPGIPAPVFGPAMTSITTGLRVGQELLQSGLATTLGVPQAAGFTLAVAVWTALVPGGVWALCAVFGVRRWFGIGLSLVAVLSASLVAQQLQSKAASLLGIALVPLVVALVAAAARPSSSRPRVPLVVAAIALTALVGTYTEYGPFVLPVVAGVVLVGRRRGTVRSVGAALAVVGIAILVSPVVWWRAWSSLGLTGGVAGSTTASANPSALLAMLTGPFRPFLVAWRDDHTATLLAAGIVAIALLLAAGLVLCLVPPDTRGLAAGTVVAAAIAVWFALRGNDYVTSRVSAMIIPLVVVAAGVGWGRLGGSREQPMPAGLLRAAAALGVVFLVGTAAVDTRTALPAVTAPVPRAFVAGDEMTQASAWVHQRADGTGAPIGVATAQLFDQLWISDQLADLPSTSYLSMRGDLGYRGIVKEQTFWNGRRTPYVLAGPGAYVAAAPSAEVAHNDRYRLVDVTGAHGSAVVVVPIETHGRLAFMTDADGGIAGVADNDLAVLTGASDARGIAVEFRDALPGTTVEARQDGRLVGEAVVGGDGTVSLSLSGARLDGGVARVQVVAPDGAPLTIAGVRHQVPDAASGR